MGYAAGHRAPAPAQADARVNSAVAVADGMGMPIEHAFVSAVLRYVTLAHGAPSAAAGELAQLEAILSTPGASATASGADRRRHRRMSVDLPAATRDADVQVPARVVDIGAGGLMLRNEGRLRMRPGDRVVVSLLPEDWPVRIDLPVEVIRKGDDDRVGVRFCGQPLVLHRRIVPPQRAAHGTAEMGAAS
jgi:hypothetical protein